MRDLTGAGRAFLPEDARSASDRAVILTHSYWRRRFGADPSVVGRTLTADRGRVTVVGVLPPNVLRYGADVLAPLVPGEYPPGRDHRDPLLFGVHSADALTYLGVSVLLAGAALLASYLPARRAMAVDPMIALRND